MERKTNTTFIHDDVMIKIFNLIEKELAGKEFFFWNRYHLDYMFFFYIIDDPDKYLILIRIK